MELPEGWRKEGKAIAKEFEFTDFLQAMNFVNKVAEAAEELNHHPDIDIRYNKVKISSWTHTEGEWTGKDVKLAEKIISLQ